MMIARWRAAPATIKAWVILTVAMFVVIALPGLPYFGGSWIVSLFWLVLWSALLLNGSRVAWWIVVVGSGIGLVVVLLGTPAGDWGPSGTVVVELLLAVSLVMLLMPSARRWTRQAHGRQGRRAGA